jgi:hypothetical protein
MNVYFIKTQQISSETSDRPVNRTLSLKEPPLQTGSCLWEMPYGDRNNLTHPGECVALAELRFHHLSKRFMEQSDYDEILLCKAVYFVRGMGLLEPLEDVDARQIGKWSW